MIKRIPILVTALLIAAQLCWSPFSVSAENYSEIIESALQYRGNISSLAGTTDGDWTAFAYGRYYNAPMEGYVDFLSEYIKKRYQTKNKLSAAKSTEWHRIILSVLASGENPYCFTDEKLNLVADGTYNRGYTISLGRQGINGWIWALIALDSVKADIPEDAFYTRDDIICEIMRCQNEDGGFSLSGNQSNADVTANVITALVPYCGNGITYTYENAKTGITMSETADTIVNEALVFISETQLESGGFVSYGDENCESSAQVLTALCTLKIDVFSDTRFIKNGNTVVDAVLGYRNPDGGFSHIQGGSSNAYATDQAAIAMIALKRFIDGESYIFDFSNLGFKESVDTVHKITTENTEVSNNTQYPHASENMSIYEDSTDSSGQAFEESYADDKLYPDEEDLNMTYDHSPTRKFPAVSESKAMVTSVISGSAKVISESGAKSVIITESIFKSTETTLIAVGKERPKKNNSAIAFTVIPSAAFALIGAVYAINQGISARRKYK